MNDVTNEVQGVKKRKLLANRKLWVGVLIALFLVGSISWYRTRMYPSTDDTYVRANITHVAAQVSGQIGKIYVLENQQVKAGQPLLDIDQRPFLIAEKAAQAQLELATQNVQAAQAAVIAAQNLVEQRQSQYDVTLKNSTRILKLVAEGQMSKSEGDTAQSNIQVTAAALAQARSQLQQAQAQLGKLGNDNATIRAAQATLAQAKLNLEYTHITATANGQIVNFQSRVGDPVIAQQPLFDLVETDQWWVNANFKETQIARIRPGQPAKITLDMYPGKTFQGKVDSIQAGSGEAFSILPPENATGNWIKVTQRIPVRIWIINPDPHYPLRVGASAVATVDSH